MSSRGGGGSARYRDDRCDGGGGGDGGSHYMDDGRNIIADVLDEVHGFIDAMDEGKDSCHGGSKGHDVPINDIHGGGVGPANNDGEELSFSSRGGGGGRFHRMETVQHANRGKDTFDEPRSARPHGDGGDALDDSEELFSSLSGRYGMAAVSEADAAENNDYGAHRPNGYGGGHNLKHEEEREEGAILELARASEDLYNKINRSYNNNNDDEDGADNGSNVEDDGGARHSSGSNAAEESPISRSANGGESNGENMPPPVAQQQQQPRHQMMPSYKKQQFPRKAFHRKHHPGKQDDTLSNPTMKATSVGANGKDPTHASTTALSSSVLSPFSAKARRMARRQQSKRFGLQNCRKVSLLLKVNPHPQLTGEWGGDDDQVDEDGYGPIMFPLLSGEAVDGDGGAATTSVAPAESKRHPQEVRHGEVILVNPHAFDAEDEEGNMDGGGGGRHERNNSETTIEKSRKRIAGRVTVETARLVAEVSQISSEDWARKYQFDDIIWPDHCKPLPSSLAAAPNGSSQFGDEDPYDAMSALASAVVSDVLSFAHPTDNGMGNDNCAPCGSSTVICAMGGAASGKTRVVFGSQVAGLVSSATRRMKSVDEGNENDLGLLGEIVGGILSSQRHASSGYEDSHGYRESSGGKRLDSLPNVICSLSILEIADDDVLRDVLSTEGLDEHSRTGALRVRHLDKRGAVVLNLRRILLTSMEELRRLLPESFRSKSLRRAWKDEGGHGHFVATISVPGPRSDSASTIQLVDLASPDRPAMGATASKSIASVRKSLSALRGVLRGVLKAQQPTNNDDAATTTSTTTRSSFASLIPYRESTLTKLLQRSLEADQGDGGSGTGSRAVLIGTVCPSSKNYSQTLGTMDFMTRLSARPGDTALSPFEAAQLEGRKRNGEDVTRKVDSLEEHRKSSLKSITSDPRQRLAKLLHTAPLCKDNSSKNTVHNASKKGAVHNTQAPVNTPKHSEHSDEQRTIPRRNFRDEYDNVFDQLDILMSADDDDSVDRNSYGEEIIQALTPYKAGRSGDDGSSADSSEGAMTPSPFRERRDADDNILRRPPEPDSDDSSEGPSPALITERHRSNRAEEDDIAFRRRQKLERRQEEDKRRLHDLFHGAGCKDGRAWDDLLCRGLSPKSPEPAHMEIEYRRPPGPDDNGHDCNSAASWRLGDENSLDESHRRRRAAGPNFRVEQAEPRGLDYANHHGDNGKEIVRSVAPNCKVDHAGQGHNGTKDGGGGNLITATTSGSGDENGLDTAEPNFQSGRAKPRGLDYAKRGHHSGSGEEIVQSAAPHHETCRAVRSHDGTKDGSSTASPDRLPHFRKNGIGKAKDFVLGRRPRMLHERERLGDDHRSVESMESADTEFRHDSSKSRRLYEGSSEKPYGDAHYNKVGNFVRKQRDDQSCPGDDYCSVASKDSKSNQHPVDTRMQTNNAEAYLRRKKSDHFMLRKQGRNAEEDPSRLREECRSVERCDAGSIGHPLEFHQNLEIRDSKASNFRPKRQQEPKQQDDQSRPQSRPGVTSLALESKDTRSNRHPELRTDNSYVDVCNTRPDRNEQEDQSFDRSVAGSNDHSLEFRKHSNPMNISHNCSISSSTQRSARPHRQTKQSKSYRPMSPTQDSRNGEETIRPAELNPKPHLCEAGQNHDRRNGESSIHHSYEGLPTCYETRIGEADDVINEAGNFMFMQQERNQQGDQFRLPVDYRSVESEVTGSITHTEIEFHRPTKSDGSDNYNISSPTLGKMNDLDESHHQPPAQSHPHGLVISTDHDQSYGRETLRVPNLNPKPRSNVFGQSHDRWTVENSSDLTEGQPTYHENSIGEGDDTHVNKAANLMLTEHDQLQHDDKSQLREDHHGVECKDAGSHTHSVDSRTPTQTKIELNRHASTSRSDCWNIASSRLGNDPKGSNRHQLATQTESHTSVGTQVHGQVKEIPKPHSQEIGQNLPALSMQLPVFDENRINEACDIMFGQQEQLNRCPHDVECNDAESSKHPADGRPPVNQHIECNGSTKSCNSENWNASSSITGNNNGRDEIHRHNLTLPFPPKEETNSHQDLNSTENQSRVEYDDTESSSGHTVNSRLPAHPQIECNRNWNASSSHRHYPTRQYIQTKETYSHQVNNNSSGLQMSASKQSPVISDAEGDGLHGTSQMCAENEGPPLGSIPSGGNEGLNDNASLFVQKPSAAPLTMLSSRDSMDSEPLVSSKGHAKFFYNSPKMINALPPLYDSPKMPNVSPPPLKSVDVPNNSPTFTMLESFTQEIDALVSNLTCPPRATKKAESSVSIPEGLSLSTNGYSGHNIQNGSASVEESVDPKINIIENELVSLKAKVHSLNEEKTVSETFIQKMHLVMSENDDTEILSDAPSSWPQTYKAFEDDMRKRQSLLVTLQSQLELSQAESIELTRELQQAENRLTELSQSVDRTEKDLEEMDSQAKASASEIKRLKEQLKDLSIKNTASCVFFGQLDALIGIGHDKASIHDEGQCKVRLDSIGSLQSRLDEELEKLEESLERERLSKNTVDKLKAKVQELENQTRLLQESSVRMEAKRVETEKIAEEAISSNEALTEEVAVLQGKLLASQKEHNSVLGDNKQLTVECEKARSLMVARDHEISALKNSLDTCQEEKMKLEHHIGTIRTKTVDVMKQRIEGLKADYTQRLEDFKASYMLEQENEGMCRLKHDLSNKEAENANLRRKIEQIEKSTSLKLQNSEDRLRAVSNEASNQKEENKEMQNELDHLRSLMDIAEESVGELNRLKEENKKLNDTIKFQNERKKRDVGKRFENDNEDDYFMHERISALMRENEQNNISMRTLQSENVTLKSSIEECTSTIHLMHSEMNELKVIANDGVSKLQKREKSLLQKQRKDRDAIMEMEKKLENAKKLFRSLRSGGEDMFSNSHVPPSSISRWETPSREIDYQATPSRVPFDERRVAAKLTAEKELRFKAEEICAGVLANSKSALEERDSEIGKLRSQLFELTRGR